LLLQLALGQALIAVKGRAFIALVAVLLLLAFAAHEGRKGFTHLAIVLGVVALVACVVLSARILGIG
jgi:hypothetical protein